MVKKLLMELDEDGKAILHLCATLRVRCADAYTNSEGIQAVLIEVDHSGAKMPSMWFLYDELPERLQMRAKAWSQTKADAGEMPAEALGVEYVQVVAEYTPDEQLLIPIGLGETVHALTRCFLTQTPSKVRTTAMSVRAGLVPVS